MDIVLYSTTFCSYDREFTCKGVIRVVALNLLVCTDIEGYCCCIVNVIDLKTECIWIEISGQGTGIVPLN